MRRALLGAVALLASRPEPARALEGHAFIAFDGQAGAVRRVAGEPLRVVPGWDFRLGLGLRGIPLTVGLGGGALTYPEMRHFDLLFRIEPEWLVLRPFVEGAAGTAHERGKPIALAWSWAAGVSFEPWRIYSGPQGSLGLALSAGVRLFRCRPVESVLALPGAPRGGLDVIAPFLGLAVFSRE